jgi:DNA repair exonuclease SbcCD nuclease subunit
MGKVALFSDIHLGVHQNNDFWLGVANKWADWYIEELKNKNITEIIFCGDFFHYRDEISVKTLNFAKDFLDKFKDFNITMITGNHDAWYKDTSEINSLTFCPWGTKIDDIPKSDIIFGHFELENFKMNMFKICDHGDDPDILVEKSKLIFTGHFHARDEKHYKQQNSSIVYIGNPYEMDFGDTLQTKGYYILDFDNLSYEFFENTITPKHIKIVLSKLINITDVENVFKKTLPGNIIKLIIDKNISSDHLDALVTKLTTYKPVELRIDYDVNYNKLKIENDEDYDLSGVDMKHAIEEFINMLDIENKKDVINYTQSLYDRVK